MPAQPSEPPIRKRPASRSRYPELERDAGMARTRIATRWIAAGSLASVGVFGALAAVSTHHASAKPVPAVTDDPAPTDPSTVDPATADPPSTGAPPTASPATEAPAATTPATTPGTKAPATPPSSAAARKPRTTPTTAAPVQAPRTRRRPAVTSGGS
jgi:hypothetical protein